MTSTTSAGSALAISAANPATADVDGYSALTYVEVGQIDKIGTIGAVYAKSEFQPLRGPKMKFKGSVDYGALSPTLALDESDAGQALLRTASDDASSKLYSFVVTYPTGAKRYFQGRVFGFPEMTDGADSIITASPSIEISTEIVRQAAPGGPEAPLPPPPAVTTMSWTTAPEYTKTEVGAGWFRVEKTSGTTSLSPSLHTTAPITGDFTIQMLRGPVFGDQILGVNDTQGATFNTIEAAIYASYGSLQAISAGAVADGGASYGQTIGVRELLVLQRVGSTMSLYQTTDFNVLGAPLKTWTNSAPFYGQMTISQMAPDAAIFIRMFEGTVEPRAADTGTPINFEDSGYVTPDNGFFRTSAFARVVYDTAATSLTLNSYNTIFAIKPEWAHLGLIVDGVYQSVAIAGNGFQTTTVALPAGNKTVEIVNGIQSNTNGIFLVSATGNAPLARKLQPAKPRIVFYGNSITNGILTDNPPHDAYPMLIRAALPNYSIALEAFGGRTLNQDCYNAAARARLVKKIAGQNPTDVYLAIGVNDFGDAVLTATQFRDQYIPFVDDLHTALPTARIHCQTLIPTSPSGPVAGTGATAADYRSVVAAIAAARPSYCNLVDGTTLVSLSKIPDGVHPNTAGHADIGPAARTAMGK